MYALAARADWRRGKNDITGTRASGRHPPDYTKDTPGPAGTNHVTCGGRSEASPRTAGALIVRSAPSSLAPQ